MKRVSFLKLSAAFLLAVFSASACGEEAAPERIPLWADDSAGQAWITVYRAGKEDGPAMVICPGGGYRSLVMEGEGRGIARWLNGNGITGILLEYRMPAGRAGVPLEDVRRAIRLARRKAGEWGINPHRLGVIGFSAGGHLASAAGTLYDEGKADAADELERISCRPDFMILIYPVITMGEMTHGGSRMNLMGPEPDGEMIRRYSTDLQVTEKTPPAFLAHALDDKSVPYDHSVRFHKAMEAHGCKSELLELPTGGHGLDGYKGPMWEKWQRRAMEWIGEIDY